MRGSAVDRFWAKVDKTETCWNWTATGSNGYGHFSLNRRSVGAHRFSFELVNPPIPAGMDIDHTCHNRSCVNPEHLRLATRKQNCENLSGAYKNSKSGIRGVYWIESGKRWDAFVGHEGKLMRVGSFSTSDEAERAVKARRLELFTHNDTDRNAA
jgi:hypothetical protein